ncbi:MAG: Na+/H+ antiporter subunit E [Candidatus Omnitrophica bacterium]|nr:Na+/H+ antiporter subunit E [Candidatus Omnitrophota bacterium]
MNRGIILFICFFLVWLGFSWPPDIQDAAFGIIVALFVSYAVKDMFSAKFRLFKNPRRYLWFLYYVVMLALGYLKAGLNIAWKIMQPTVPLNPGIVKIKTKLKNETALALLANSLTLSSDVLSVDIDKDGGFLYVHWLNVASEDADKATKIIADKFEKVLERIFEQ